MDVPADVECITAEHVRTALTYDSATGVFRWRVRPALNMKAGGIAGTVQKGYVFIKLCGRRHLSHRLAWLYVHGQWPQRQIDHINGVGTDNRLENLRLATPVENAQNHRRRRTNTSGFTGVTFRKDVGKWQARIGVAHRRVSLGFFVSREEAAAVYALAKAKFHHFQPVERAA